MPILLLVFAGFWVGDDSERLPFDQAFLENSIRYDVKESMLKRTMTFIAENGAETRCKYGFPFVSVSSANFKKDNPVKSKTSSKIINAFSQESFAVKAVSRSEDVDTYFGKSRKNQAAIEILDPDTGETHGFFDLKITAETVLGGSFKRDPIILREVTIQDGNRLPLFDSNRYPSATTGYFEFVVRGRTSACLVLYPRPNKKIAYSLFVDRALDPDKHNDIISLMLLFPVLRTIGPATLH